VTYRKLKAIDAEAFKRDLTSKLPLTGSGSASSAALLASYDRCLQELVDAHAPLCTRTITLHPSAPWYTNEIGDAKRKRRKLERKWYETRLEIYKQIYRQQCQVINRLIKRAKQAFYKEKVSSCNRDPKALAQITSQLLGQKNSTDLPDANCNCELAEKFSTYFTSKIKSLRDDLDAQPSDPIAEPPSAFAGTIMDVLAPATEDEIHKLISSAPCKHCSLDPIPTWLLKNCAAILVPHITLLVNASLNEGTVPSEMKQANITPLLKKPGLDQQSLKNYRPVSNLSVTSKILERVVASRLENHLQRNMLQSGRQSAYRKYHSTETAMLKVYNDLLEYMDQGHPSVLVLLDLSAAFDTLDHSILLQRLELQFGITGQALKWFESYLCRRFQTVMVEGERSCPQLLEYGVPQGSVLGPKLYSLYTTPLGQKLEETEQEHIFYADDTQVYNDFIPSHIPEQSEGIQHIQQGLETARTWFAENKLKLNSDKTEVITLAPKNSQCTDVSVVVGDSVVQSKPVVRDLGVLVDSSLSMEAHVNNICKSASYHLRNIGSVRRYLSADTTKSLIQALVSSRLDYCNALLIGLPKARIYKLKRIQNASARVISGTRRHEHITPVLQNLHWLPVESRVEYKIILHTYKALCGEAPQYLQELIQRRIPSRALRSSNTIQLLEPKVRTKGYGERSFRSAAPRLWNQLPDHMKRLTSVCAFKRTLKTHLFKSAYKL
jgi:hypothetical protein